MTNTAYKKKKGLKLKAHREFHKIYGFKNNTKGQLKEFLITKK